jgi:hypothetical protein
MGMEFFFSRFALAVQRVMHVMLRHLRFLQGVAGAPPF